MKVYHSREPRGPRAAAPGPSCRVRARCVQLPFRSAPFAARFRWHLPAVAISARPRPAERQKIKRALSLPTPHATAPSASRFGRPRVARPARRRAPPRAGEAPRALARPLLSRDSEGPARESRDTPRAREPGHSARLAHRVSSLTSRLSGAAARRDPSSCRARQTFRLVARSRARGVCSRARVLWSSRRTCLPAW